MLVNSLYLFILFFCRHELAGNASYHDLVITMALYLEPAGCITLGQCLRNYIINLFSSKYLSIQKEDLYQFS